MALAVPVRWPVGLLCGWVPWAVCHQSAHQMLPDMLYAEGVRGEGVDGSRGPVAVFGGVAAGEVAAPDVAAVLATGGEFVSPRVPALIEAAAGGVLPFGFGGKTQPAPICSTRWRRSRRCGRRGACRGRLYGCQGLGGVPSGALHCAPPGCGLHTRGNPAQCVGKEAGEDEGPAVPFGVGPVAGCLGEGTELCFRHGVGGDEERRWPGRRYPYGIRQRPGMGCTSRRAIGYPSVLRSRRRGRNPAATPARHSAKPCGAVAWCSSQRRRLPGRSMIAPVITAVWLGQTFRPSVI